MVNLRGKVPLPRLLRLADIHEEAKTAMDEPKSSTHKCLAGLLLSVSFCSQLLLEMLQCDHSGGHENAYLHVTVLAPNWPGVTPYA